MPSFRNSPSFRIVALTWNSQFVTSSLHNLHWGRILWLVCYNISISERTNILLHGEMGTLSDPGEIQLFPCLQMLKITKCNKLLEVPLHYLKSSVTKYNLSNCNMITKNVGMYFRAMTALTQLYLGGYEELKINLCCAYLRELQLLTLKNIKHHTLKDK